MIPVEVLIRPVSADELLEKVLQALEDVDVPARSWRSGGVARSMLGVGVIFGAMGIKAVQGIVKGFFLAYGEGDNLTAHCQDVYDVERQPATFATAAASAQIVKITNTGGTPFTVGANETILKSSNVGARYVVTDAYVLPAGGYVWVSVRAIEAGSASSVAPAELDEFETPLSPRVTVTNVGSIVGRDEETDEQLRARCRAKKGAWSPFGPRDAYEYAALTATLIDGTPTSINRVRVSRFSSTGRVKIVCATPTGSPSVDELAAVVTACEKIARPDTVRLDVVGAVQVATTHTVTLWANGGTDTLIASAAQKALASFYATYPIGGIAKTDGGAGKLYLDAIAAVIIGSSAEAFDVDFAPGSADFTLADNEVATNTTTIEVRVR